MGSDWREWGQTGGNGVERRERGRTRGVDLGGRIGRSDWGVELGGSDWTGQTGSDWGLPCSK